MKQKRTLIFVLLTFFLGGLLLPSLADAAGFFWAAGTHRRGAGACVDGNDAYTKILIQSNTTDGSTTFVDSASGSTTHPITAVNAVHHETSQYKWGTSSIEYTASSSDALTVANSPDWNFGTGEFTIRCGL